MNFLLLVPNYCTTKGRQRKPWSGMKIGGDSSFNKERLRAPHQENFLWGRLYRKMPNIDDFMLLD